MRATQDGFGSTVRRRQASPRADFRADRYVAASALLKGHGGPMWQVTISLVGEPEARSVVVAAAGIDLHHQQTGASRLDLLAAVGDLARSMPDANGAVDDLPGRVREAYVLTQVGETAQALGSTVEEVRAACKMDKGLLMWRQAVPRPRQPVGSAPANAARTEMADV